jgi:hypothetical protein
MGFLISSVILAMFFGLASVLAFGPDHIPDWTQAVVWGLIGAGSLLRLLELVLGGWCRRRRAVHGLCRLSPSNEAA